MSYIDNLKDIIKNKKRKLISSEEALQDVEPFFTEDELNNIIENNITIEIK